MEKQHSLKTVKILKKKISLPTNITILSSPVTLQIYPHFVQLTSEYIRALLLLAIFI